MSDANPARLVADADVLAADLFLGDAVAPGSTDAGTPSEGDARRAMDLVRSHSWIELVASDALLDDAAFVIETVADAGLAADWRERIEELATLVDHPPGDHPALAAAHHGDAPHVLTFDESLRSAAAGAAIRARVETSVKHPGGFVALFDPARMYPTVVGGDYPGPDRDPRA